MVYQIMLRLIQRRGLIEAGNIESHAIRPKGISPTHLSLIGSGLKQT